jgi:hypothetical protein
MELEDYLLIFLFIAFPLWCSFTFYRIGYHKGYKKNEDIILGMNRNFWVLYDATRREIWVETSRK